MAKKFKLDAEQKRRVLRHWGLTTAAFALAAIIVANVADASDGQALFLSALVGLAIGFSVRWGTQFAWQVEASTWLAQKAMAWTRGRKFSVAWRSVAIFFAGRVIISFLDSLAWSSFSEVILMAIGLSAITATSLFLGLAFGWSEAIAESMTPAFGPVE